MKVKEQEITDQYCMYNADCCKVLPEIQSDSVGLTIHSPPFASLYSYSDEIADMGNNSYEGFFKHYQFLIEQLFRVTMPGRNVAVHCMDIPTYKRNGEEMGLKDFSGEIIRAYQKAGFTFHSRHCIWKDPLVAATRTKALGLAHKQIVKDSSLCRMGIPDYLLAFRKPGENPKPIKNESGLTEYHGARKIPQDLRKFLSEENQGKNKRSHWIWQQYASPVWIDIRQTKVLPFRSAREEDDERHVAPLQLDVIERCIVLWSTRGDVVLDPFSGIGSTIYVAVKNGRKGLGVELKPRYFRQSLRNLHSLSKKSELNGE